MAANARRAIPRYLCARRYRVILTAYVFWKGEPGLRNSLRRFAACSALLALLLPGVSALARTLSAPALPPCCNTVYCPLHHRSQSDLQRDRANCDGMSVPGAQMDCSMRACDAAPGMIVGYSAFVLIVPAVLRVPAMAETTSSLDSSFFPFVAATPPIPPPRSFPG